MGTSTIVSRTFSVLGIVSALLGIFVLYGISIEIPGIMLGALGYYFGLKQQDRSSQVLGIAAVVLCTISIFLSGLEAPPQ